MITTGLEPQLEVTKAAFSPVWAPSHWRCLLKAGRWGSPCLKARSSRAYHDGGLSLPPVLRDTVDSQLPETSLSPPHGAASSHFLSTFARLNETEWAHACLVCEVRVYHKPEVFPSAGVSIRRSSGLCRVTFLREGRAPVFLARALEILLGGSGALWSPLRCPGIDDSW